MLESVGRLRKRVAHQIFQLHLAEGTARLLVRQDILKVRYLAGQGRDMFVRLFNHRQLFRHAGERAVGPFILVAKRLFQPRAESPLAFLHGRGHRLLQRAGLRHQLRQLTTKLGQGFAVARSGLRLHLAQDQNDDSRQKQQQEKGVDGHESPPDRVATWPESGMPAA